MSDIGTPPTDPTPSPGDQLVGRVILALAGIAALCLTLIGVGMGLDRTIPDVLSQVAIASVTALGAVLAGRTRG